MLRPTTFVCFSLSLFIAHPVFAQDDLRQVFEREAKKKGVTEPETRIYRLEWIPAQEAGELLKKLAASGSERVTLHADPRSNSVIAHATTETLDEMRAVLDRIDQKSEVSTIGIVVTVWEVVGADGAFDRVLADEFDIHVPYEASTEKMHKEVFPRLVANGYLRRPVTLRTSVLCEQQASVGSKYRCAYVEAVDNGREAFKYLELGASIDLLGRQAGNQVVLQFKLDDSREVRPAAADGPSSNEKEPGNAGPPTIASTSIRSTLSIRSGATEMHLIGGDQAGRGVQLLVVVGVRSGV